MEAKRKPPNIVVEFVRAHQDVLACVARDTDDSRAFVVDDQPIAGASDHFGALIRSLDAAVDWETFADAAAAV